MSSLKEKLDGTRDSKTSRTEDGNEYSLKKLQLPKKTKTVRQMEASNFCFEGKDLISLDTFLVSDRSTNFLKTKMILTGKTKPHTRMHRLPPIPMEPRVAANQRARYCYNSLENETMASHTGKEKENESIINTSSEKDSFSQISANLDSTYSIDENGKENIGNTINDEKDSSTPRNCDNKNNCTESNERFDSFFDTRAPPLFFDTLEYPYELSSVPGVTVYICFHRFPIIYMSGEHLSGILRMKVPERFPCLSISVGYELECEIETSMYKVYDPCEILKNNSKINRQHHMPLERRMQEIWSEELYNRQYMERGIYDFGFSFLLDKWFPTSYKDDRMRVEYALKLRIKLPNTSWPKIDSIGSFSLFSEPMAEPKLLKSITAFTELNQPKDSRSKIKFLIHMDRTIISCIDGGFKLTVRAKELWSTDGTVWKLFPVLVQRIDTASKYIFLQRVLVDHYGTAENKLLKKYGEYEGVFHFRVDNVIPSTFQTEEGSNALNVMYLLMVNLRREEDDHNTIVFRKKIDVICPMQTYELGDPCDFADVQALNHVASSGTDVFRPSRENDGHTLLPDYKSPEFAEVESSSAERYSAYLSSKSEELQKKRSNTTLKCVGSYPLLPVAGGGSIKEVDAKEEKSEEFDNSNDSFYPIFIESRPCTNNASEVCTFIHLDEKVQIIIPKKHETVLEPYWEHQWAKEFRNTDVLEKIDIFSDRLESKSHKRYVEMLSNLLNFEHVYKICNSHEETGGHMFKRKAFVDNQRVIYRRDTFRNAPVTCVQIRTKNRGKPVHVCSLRKVMKKYGGQKVNIFSDDAFQDSSAPGVRKSIKHSLEKGDGEDYSKSASFVIGDKDGELSKLKEPESNDRPELVQSISPDASKECDTNPKSNDFPSEIDNPTRTKFMSRDYEINSNDSKNRSNLILNENYTTDKDALEMIKSTNNTTNHTLSEAIIYRDIPISNDSIDEMSTNTLNDLPTNIGTLRPSEINPRTQDCFSRNDSKSTEGKTNTTQKHNMTYESTYHIDKEREAIMNVSKGLIPNKPADENINFSLNENADDSTNGIENLILNDPKAKEENYSQNENVSNSTNVTGYLVLNEPTADEDNSPISESLHNSTNAIDKLTLSEYKAVEGNYSQHENTDNSTNDSQDVILNNLIADDFPMNENMRKSCYGTDLTLNEPKVYKVSLNENVNESPAEEEHSILNEHITNGTEDLILNAPNKEYPPLNEIINNTNSADLILNEQTITYFISSKSTIGTVSYQSTDENENSMVNKSTNGPSIFVLNESTINQEGSILNESTHVREGSILNESTHDREGSILNESTHVREGSIMNESTHVREGSILNESTHDREGSILNESTHDREGSILNESTHDREGSILNESTHDREGSILNESTHVREGSILNESTHVREGSILNESTHDRKGSLLNESTHDREGSILNESTHVREGSILNESTHVREGSILNESTHVREGSILNESTHDRKGSLLNESTHDREGSILNESTHDRKGSLLNESTHDREGSILNESTHVREGSILNESTHDREGSILNESTHDREGSVLNESTHDRKGFILNESTHDTEGSILNESTYNREGSIFNESTYNREGSTLNESTHDRERSILNKSTHDREGSILNESTHDGKGSILNWSTNEREGSILNESKNNREGSILDESTHNRERSILNESSHDVQGSILNESSHDVEGSILNESKHNREGSILNESTHDGEGSLLNESTNEGSIRNESTHDRKGFILNESTHDTEGSILNESTYNREGSIFNESTYNREGSTLNESTHDRERSILNKSTHDREGYILNESTHDKEGSILNESTHDGKGSILNWSTNEREGSILNESKNNREGSILDESTHNRERSILNESSHDVQGSILNESSHDVEGSILNESKHNREGSILNESTHDREGSILNESTHDGKGSILNWSTNEREGSIFNESTYNREGSTLNESTHDREGSILNKSTHDREGYILNWSTNEREGSILNESKNNREGSILDESTHNREGSILNESTHDKEGSILNESTHDKEGSILNESTHDKEGSILDESTHDRKGSILNESTHDKEGSILNESKNNREGSILDESTHNREGSILNESKHNREGSTLDESTHNREGSILNESTHDGEGSILNWSTNEREGSILTESLNNTEGSSLKESENKKDRFAQHEFIISKQKIMTGQATDDQEKSLLTELTCESSTQNKSTTNSRPITCTDEDEFTGDDKSRSDSTIQVRNELFEEALTRHFDYQKINHCKDHSPAEPFCCKENKTIIKEGSKHDTNRSEHYNVMFGEIYYDALDYVKKSSLSSLSKPSPHKCRSTENQTSENVQSVILVNTIGSKNGSSTPLDSFTNKDYTSTDNHQTRNAEFVKHEKHELVNTTDNKMICSEWLDSSNSNNSVPHETALSNTSIHKVINTNRIQENETKNQKAESNDESLSKEGKKAKIRKPKIADRFFKPNSLSRRKSDNDNIPSSGKPNDSQCVIQKSSVITTENKTVESTSNTRERHSRQNNDLIEEVAETHDQFQDNKNPPQKLAQFYPTTADVQDDIINKFRVKQLFEGVTYDEKSGSNAVSETLENKSNASFDKQKDLEQCNDPVSSTDCWHMKQLFENWTFGGSQDLDMIVTSNDFPKKFSHKTYLNRLYTEKLQTCCIKRQRLDLEKSVECFSRIINPTSQVSSCLNNASDISPETIHLPEINSNTGTTSDFYSNENLSPKIKFDCESYQKPDTDSERRKRFILKKLFEGSTHDGKSNSALSSQNLENCSKDITFDGGVTCEKNMQAKFLIFSNEMSKTQICNKNIDLINRNVNNNKCVNHQDGNQAQPNMQSNLTSQGKQLCIQNNFSTQHSAKVNKETGKESEPPSRHPINFNQYAPFKMDELESSKAKWDAKICNNFSKQHTGIWSHIHTNAWSTGRDVYGDPEAVLRCPFNDTNKVHASVPKAITARSYQQTESNIVSQEREVISRHQENTEEYESLRVKKQWYTKMILDIEMGLRSTWQHEKYERLKSLMEEVKSIDQKISKIRTDISNRDTMVKKTQVNVRTDRFNVRAKPFIPRFHAAVLKNDQLTADAHCLQFIDQRAYDASTRSEDPNMCPTRRTLFQVQRPMQWEKQAHSHTDAFTLQPHSERNGR